MNFANIVTSLGFSEEAAAKIALEWDASEKSFSGGNALFFIQHEFIRKYGEMGKVKPEHLEEIISNSAKLAANAAVVRLLWHYYHLLYRAENKLAPDLLPKVESLSESEAGSFYFLLVIAAYPDTIELYQRKKGYPEDVLKDTLSDISVWVEHYKNQLGFAGLTPRILGWMQGHIHGETFRLGRLQFKPHLSFYDRVEVYRNIKSGRTFALSAAGIRYNPQGLLYEPEIDGCECRAWTSIFRQDATSVTGNPVKPDGYASPDTVTLNLDGWKKVLAAGDPVIDIHIPAIGAMTVEACADSVNRAADFMAKFFPELQHRAFSCESWLLDNQFEQILKPESNIIQFQRAGYLYPFPHKSEAVPRIFGENAEQLSVDSLQRKSSLQKAAAAFLANGGTFRNGATFLLMEDLPWGSNPYRSA